MRVLVPFAAETPKTRLADVLAAGEWRRLAGVMLRDVLDAIRETGRDPEVLATADVAVDAPVTVDERPLTPAVNAALADEAGATAVVMADLALATPSALERLFEASGDVVIVPGRGGGTNALVIDHPEFRVNYHGASYRDHVGAAEVVGADLTVVDSHRLATDVDTRSDLVEVLLHGEGRSAEWLRQAGFHLVVEDGRVGVDRR